jgi:hypothetical protein
MWIEFGIINYKLIIPFIYPFLSLLSDYIHKDDIKPFYEIFIGYVAYLVSGLVYLIIKCRMKKIAKENDSNEMDEKKTISASELKEIIDIKDRNTNLYNRISIGKKKINSRFKRKKYLFLLLITITYLIPCKKKIMCYEGHFAGIISGIKQCSGINDLLYSILMAIGLFMTALGLWLTVEYLSPCHFLTSDSIITFSLNILVDCYKDFFLMVNPLFYILSLITIFACLVYNEIIIINICKFNYYTSKYINNRQSIEYIENNLTILDNKEDNFSLDNNQRSNFNNS